MDYVKLAATARALLAKFGSIGQLTTSVAGTYDPATGTVPQTVTTQDIIAAVFAYAEGLINGATILQGDQLAYVSAVGLTMPKAGDVMVWQGSDYQVVNAKPLAPAGINVLAILQVRK
jgi:hypothetical protein